MPAPFTSPAPERERDPDAAPFTDARPEHVDERDLAEARRALAQVVKTATQIDHRKLPERTRARFVLALAAAKAEVLYAWAELRDEAEQAREDDRLQ